MTQISFGEWLKRRRKSLGLTQEQLARQLNCSAIILRKIEAEERRPSEQLFELFADKFSISTKDRPDFLKFARGDWPSGLSEIYAQTSWQATAASNRSVIPSSPTSLIGREREIADARAYLLKADIRLVTLIGPPGTGKTRLCAEVARKVIPDFSDGVFFVALAALDDSSLLVPTIAQALGFVESKQLSITELLKDGVGEKNLLLVLDNCEHLIEAAASLIAVLLSACSNLKILCTSREALRIPGEWLFLVPPLGLPKEISLIDLETSAKYPALTLFSERACAVRSDFALNAGNLQTIAAICTQLDGLPLAIELIASRIRLMSPQALLERLNDQYVLSADGMRGISARPKTLNNAIGGSFSTLSPEEQKIFTYLAVLSGGFTLESVEKIFSETFLGRSVPNLITSLLDKSLLQRSSDLNGELRFNMLVTVQQFALNSLRCMDHEAEAREAHLAHFLDLAEQVDREIRGPMQAEWVNRLESEHDNIRAALEWCISDLKTESALHLLCALG